MFPELGQSNEDRTGRDDYLVHHHHRKEVADSGKKKAVQVVRHVVANRVAEDVKNDLADDEEEHPKGDVTQRPSVLQRVGDEDDLHNDVDEQEDAIDEIQNHEQAQRIRRAQAELVLERQDRHRAGDEEHADRRASQQPHGLCGAIFVQLKPHEPIDE